MDPRLHGDKNDKKTKTPATNKAARVSLVF